MRTQCSIHRTKVTLIFAAALLAAALTVGVMQVLAAPARALGGPFTPITGAGNPFNGVDVGGKSTPAFVDIDGDGDMDAFVGESDGTLSFYRNTGTAITPTFTSVTGAGNPLDGVDVWMYSAPAFVDIDGDGDMDAFIGAYDGYISFYRNTGTAISPTFTLVTGAGNPFNGVDVGLYSAPTFADIDSDGDMDAFIGAYDGTLNWYENVGTAISPTFTLGASVDVGDYSAFTFMDIDGDGDMDLFVGGLDGTINLYRNFGTATYFMILLSNDPGNPFNGVDVGIQSAPTFVDIDGDGDMDAFVGAEDGTLRFYRNEAVALAPAPFTAVTGAGNPLDGVDVGSRSAPAFVDIDGDGDMDGFVGKQAGTLNFYRNTGTAISPTFTLVTGAGNPFDGVNAGAFSAPAFVDIDGDGDMDGFVGEYDGILNFYRNTGTAITSIFTVVTGAGDPFDGVDVGSYSAPAFVDVDGDGDMDAFVGASDGTLYFYRNTGTAITPTFTRVTGAGDPFDGVDVGSYSAPAFVDVDGDGDMDGFVGENGGNINFYRNTGTAISPTFILVSGAGDPFDGVNAGAFSTPTFVDVDGDGDRDAFVGEYDGTLYFYRNTGPYQMVYLPLVLRNY